MTSPLDFTDSLAAPQRARVEQYWQRFNEAASRAELGPLSEPELLNVLFRVWCGSEFVASSSIRQPRMLLDLIDSGDLHKAYLPGTWAAKLYDALSPLQNEKELASVLRQLRMREMVRIAWRDLAGWADLGQTLADLSRLAEACLNAALDKLHNWQMQEWGKPCDTQGKVQSLNVLGMGKLGAGELNFSSDIDLIFAYPEAGETTGGTRVITNTEYFVRLAQRLINALAARTADGFVYRVDMRLRPFGESGPLALSFAALEDYYQNHGREWERFAMVKARVVAGDPVAGARLMASLRPFVYRRYLDFGVFDSLRGMHALIAQETRRKGLHDNIKLGQGGIREIEFIGQVFQLLRGGRDARLRMPGILMVLSQLGAADYLPASATEDLTAAYIFLRSVENHLQEWRDEQTHTLPKDCLERERLAYSMNFANWDDFNQLLQQHMTRVHAHFALVFAAPQIETTPAQSSTADANGIWQGRLDEARAREVLTGLGFPDPTEVLRVLTQLRQGHRYKMLSECARKHMDGLMPLLITDVGQARAPNVTLMRLVNLIEAIIQRSAYLALLAENPQALSQLVTLCAASPWISALLTRHPLLLDELLDPRRLYKPLDRGALRDELTQLVLRVPEDDLEQQMEVLRHFKQVQVLRVAAADTAGVLPLMVVSDYLSGIAELILQEVLNLAWQHLVERHGVPQCVNDGTAHTPGFAIVAYGKLGGIELGYGSDLDLVFLHDSAGERQQTSGPKALDNAVFFARLGQRIMHILGARTPAGVLYEIDVRLRPSGASGLLVSSLESFAQYQMNQAWTWEHQALLRARVVAGMHSATITRGFEHLRREVLMRKRDAASLALEVADMRARMRSALALHEPGCFDLKQGAGGIADIEFMVQYGALLWAHQHPQLLTFTDNIRVLQGFADAGLMPVGDAQLLMDAYRAYRAAAHRSALQDEVARVAEHDFADYRTGVTRIWQGHLAGFTG